MSFDEHALSFPCQHDWLHGVASVPPAPAARGVLIVVGGPQYRAGSHRQFTLLARSLAGQGIPAMRFDYRGMGDSEGAVRDFRAVDADLRAAVDAFLAAVPGLREVVIWGLCDAASAALFYAAGDARVTGLVLLNPWVRTSEGLAKATLKHYYRARLLERAFWAKLASGKIEFGAAAASLARQLRAAFGRRRPDRAAAAPQASLPERMLSGFSQFRGRILLIISGADLTAQEFIDLAGASPAWQRQLADPRVALRRLDGADHTFSRRAWRDQVAAWSAEWVGSW
jgi:exosortase A-associated hydrolase 1